jgi:hypothetical protein
MKGGVKTGGTQCPWDARGQVLMMERQHGFGVRLVGKDHQYRENELPEAFAAERLAASAPELLQALMQLASYVVTLELIMGAPHHSKFTVQALDAIGDAIGIPQ